MNKKYVAFLPLFFLVGCVDWIGSQEFASTQAEQLAGYSYIPVEPSTVKVHCVSMPGDGNNCAKITKKEILSALPDNSVRIATHLVTGTAKIGLPVFGSDIGVEGNTYEVIIDFVNTQTVNKQFIGKWFISLPDQINARSNRCYPMERSVLNAHAPDKYENWSLTASLSDIGSDYRAEVSKFDAFEQEKPEKKEITLNCGYRANNKSGEKILYDKMKITAEPFNIPVYIGIGLRLKANVTVIKGNVNLSSLPALTAAVSAGNATGTMSVQTIGISGKSARSNLLLLDKIDATTIQNAIQVLSSIKASIESTDTVITPRIVGFHNAIGAGAQGINLLHSLLASDAKMSLAIDPVAFAAGNE